MTDNPRYHRGEAIHLLEQDDNYAHPPSRKVKLDMAMAHAILALNDTLAPIVDYLTTPRVSMTEPADPSGDPAFVYDVGGVRKAAEIKFPRDQTAEDMNVGPLPQGVKADRILRRLHEALGNMSAPPQFKKTLEASKYHRAFADVTAYVTHHLPSMPDNPVTPTPVADHLTRTYPKPPRNPWRMDTHYPTHVYEEHPSGNRDLDRPVATFQREADAACAVEAFNKNPSN